MLLKYGHSLEHDLVGLKKGVWPARVARYKALFGSVPPELQGAVSDLEQIRRFGSEGEVIGG